MFRITAIVFFAILASVPAQAAERLTAKQVKALIPGSFTGLWQGKNTITIKVAMDGSLTGISGPMSDTGAWRVDGRRLCVTFKSWTDNKERCGEVYKDGNQYMGFIQDGQAQLRFRKN